ncbi:metallophosphoesterase [Micromonospora sp. MH33]|uniref:metallophosphoesterase family protein n=1 Tax=Micromonospora sp. MH33 TaxID=1945509 RepID=UPI00248B3733|nr:metallophosphoesterase [Micromonospora sp. MH33]
MTGPLKGDWCFRGGLDDAHYRYMMIIAHISDTHLDGSERALARTRRVMRYLRGCDIDLILVSGDLADHGEIPEYQEGQGRTRRRRAGAHAARQPRQPVGIPQGAAGNRR